MKKRNFIVSCLKTAVLAVIIFAMTAGSVCEAKAAVSFPDVADPNSYYYDAVYWAVEEGITTGRGGYFKPNQVCTRAEAVTFLYRLAGGDEVTGESGFADVTNTNIWYYKPVIWAVQNGITDGYGVENGQPVFKPDVPCNRAMIVTLLMRYAKEINGDYANPSSSQGLFPDTAEGSWYAGAVRWAAANGITTGKGDGKFYPMEGCTRAQIVTFLYRYAHMTPPGDDIELEEIPIEDL